MSETEQAAEVDVIVVGSGSGGAVVTRRLVDAGVRVLLLEAGLPDDNPAIHDPGRLFELWDSEQDWGYRTTPQTAGAGRRRHWPRGRVLGGSSALNAMIYIRGHRSDYDAWAYLGNEGWGYDDVLPVFKRSEDFDLGASAYHGSGGPLRGHLRVRAAPVHRGGGRGGAGGRDPVQRRPQRGRARRGRLLPADRQGRAAA